MSVEMNSEAIAAIKRRAQDIIDGKTRPRSYRERPPMEIPNLSKASSGSSSSQSSRNHSPTMMANSGGAGATPQHATASRQGSSSRYSHQHPSRSLPRSPSRYNNKNNAHIPADVDKNHQPIPPRSPAETRRMRADRRAKRIETATSPSSSTYPFEPGNNRDYRSKTMPDDNTIFRGAQILRQQLMLAEAGGLPDSADYNHNEYPSFYTDKTPVMGNNVHTKTHQNDPSKQALLGGVRQHSTGALLLRAEMVTRVIHDQVDDDVDHDDEDRVSLGDTEMNSSDDWSDPWETTPPRDGPPPTTNEASYRFRDMNRDGKHPEMKARRSDVINFPDAWPELTPLNPSGEERSTFSFPTKGDASEWAELSSTDSREHSNHDADDESEELLEDSIAKVLLLPKDRAAWFPGQALNMKEALSSPSNSSPETVEGKGYRDNTTINNKNYRAPLPPSSGVRQALSPLRSVRPDLFPRQNQLTVRTKPLGPEETDEESGLTSNNTTNVSSLTSPSNYTANVSSLTSPSFRNGALVQQQQHYHPHLNTPKDSSYLPGMLLRSASPEAPMDDVSRVNGKLLFNRDNISMAKFETSPSHAELKEAAIAAAAANGYVDSLHLLQDLREDEHYLMQEAERRSDIGYFLEVGKNDPNVGMFQNTPGAYVSTGTHDRSPPPTKHVVSPKSKAFDVLRRDPAYCHAQRAGQVWQSLVSQHVRFPSSWWNGARSPPLGVADRQLWLYMGRHRVVDNAVLNGLIQHRGSAGRLLLHIVVRDLMTLAPVQDVVIGCFHPNARGIRTSENFSPTLEDCRDVWLTVRRRNGACSVIETLIQQGNNVDNTTSISQNDGSDSSSDSEVPSADHSPLGEKHAVHNGNMRAVFGETPPLQTMFLMENELYELLSKHVSESMPPALVLMEEFLHHKC